MYKVLVTDNVNDEGLTKLYEHEHFTVDKNTELPPKEIKEIIHQYDALIVRNQTKVTKEIIEHAANLKVIARAGVGVDNIDVDAATRKGIIVVNSPGGNTISATEHTLAMMLSLSRNIPQAHQSTTNGLWERDKFKGVELYQKTLGVIGMGKIGTEVAKRAQAFKMTILGYDPYLTEERASKLGIKKATLNEIAAASDFITVHTPLIKDTKHLINEAFLAKTKKGVRLVNCARGGLIDEHALLAALHSGHVAGAALDVFENEPKITEGLLKQANVIVTPHLGASTQEAQIRVAIDVSEEIINIFESQSIRNAINMPQTSGEVQGRMEPYLMLGEQVAQIGIQLLNDAPEKIDITYAGELIEEDTSLLTRTIIKGILTYHLGESVNLVNAIHLLKEQGLTYNIQKNAKNKGFSNYLELTLHKHSKEIKVGAAIINGFGARIVKLNEYRIDVRPEQHLLYIKHQDIPGMIGQVGSILGKNDTNIGTMQVGRKEIGGEAIMVLTLDKKIEQNVADNIKSLIGMKDIQTLELTTGYNFQDSPFIEV
ncbi:D-3-phosphoglycerate dehydrogenase [Heyndrickxia ginsengihumi]|uniref:D-3-phosphoglycerate dehydrogenase n=1 Tax=Heyndrickxia ginsengihumi TaxID=363870 RepID=A0A0A6V8L8_9BACI|nr:phosphoglycerate dehydrogenase [Heyndrickxia ginsengihumi]KHD84395.1 D-3-phosphoglycerate dehydrogenase [Heyndrickxia ginsengihumi]